MKTEKFNLVVDRYIDDFDQPCCARSFTTGEVCPFYRTKNFGFHETCVFIPDESMLQRREGPSGRDTGTLIPDKSCPIWNKTDE